MTPAAFAALCARVWARQAPSSRWQVAPPAPAHAATGAGSTKIPDALASEGQDTPMAQPPQDEPLDLSNDVNWCRGCGQRRVLCAFGQCVQCHYDSSKQGWLKAKGDTARHLCCDWWGTGALREAWRCPTCGKVHG
jgi:hypothetical protein